MMQLLPQFDAAARVVLAVLFNGLWQGALIAFVAWLALFVFRSANASTRYAVWLLALAAVVAVPIATSCVSVDRPGAFQLEGAPPHSSHVAAGAPARRVVAAPPSAQHRVYAQTTDTHAPAITTVIAHNGAHRLAVPTFVAAVAVALWLVTVLAVLVRLGIALFTLERLKHDALPLALDYRDRMPRWEAAVKGQRDVRICVSEQIEVPVAVGLFDAMILLPSHLVQSLEPAEIDQISLHELAHLLRADDWTNALQRVACALLFFNPAVWFIARQLDIEREVACDDYVLQLTGAVRPYAFCLTKMAEMTSWPHRPVPAPGVFVTRKNISIRIERLLRTGRAIGSQIAPNVAVSAVVALLAMFFVVRTMTPSIAYTEAPTALPSAAPIPAPSAHRAEVVKAHVEELVKQSIAQNVVASPSPHGGDSYDCMGCDYAHANLQNKDFSNRNLQGVNFAHANLAGSRFDHAQLMGANFAGADLRNVSFTDANLEGCNMKGAQLAGARFDGAQLTGCTIDARELSPGQARAVLLTCMGCNFSHADLHGINLRGMHLQGANLAYADLRNADLRDADFTGVNFNHAVLSGALVDKANFMGCTFSGADLRDVDLSKASMTGSSLGDAIMRE